MKYLNQYLVLLLFFVPILEGFGQKQFVTFETTSKSFTVCEGKVLGIIAHIEPQFENCKSFSWKEDIDVINKAKNNVASVNTSKPGVKMLAFSLQLNNDEVLDTIITINVLPKPTASISFSDNKNSIELISTQDIVSYKWIQNNKITDEFANESFAKPAIGNYKAQVRDNKGCVAISESILINKILQQ